MPHKWSAEHAGTVRDGWTLRRDCLTCGVEHWVRERPGVLPGIHEYRNAGQVIHVGRHATPCKDKRKVEPGMRVIVEGRKWTVLVRPRDGVYRRIQWRQTQSHADATEEAITAARRLSYEMD